MATSKKRASFSSSSRIAVQAHASNLEDDTPVVPPHAPEVQPIPPDAEEVSLEQMLAADASEPQLTRRNRVIYSLGVGLTLVSIAAAIGMYGFYLKQDAPKPVAEPQTAVQTISPTPVADRQSVTLEVLNGSGVSGKASKTADTLKEKGYTILGTGNAKKIPQSTISFSPGVSDQLRSLVIADLQLLGVSSVAADLVSATVSARITLGLK